MLFKPRLQRALKRHLVTVLQGERQSPQRLAYGRLFARAIGYPKLIILKALAAVELLAAGMAFITLSSIAPPVLFDLF